MAKFGSASVAINVDDSGGTTRALTDYITEFNGVEIEAIQDVTTAFGDAWEESLGTGMQKASDIQLKGFYDDTATSGPHVVLRALDSSPSATARQFSIVFGGTNGTIGGDIKVFKYKVTGKVGNLTTFESTLRPTGTLTWS